MHEAFQIFAMSMALLAPLPVQTSLQVARFNSIDLPNGGHVVVRPAATQRVTLVRGSLDYTRLRVTDAGALVIDKCFRKCPRGYRLELEIFAPNLNRLSLANGGSIQSRGSFPRQSDLTVAVGHGGTIDVRSMVAQRVVASVQHGGRILTVPQAQLFATVDQGGVIIYWGGPQVRSSIKHGGTVNRGNPDEVDLPVTDVGLSALSPTIVDHTERLRIK
jgi:hypothetical protein